MKKFIAKLLKKKLVLTIIGLVVIGGGYYGYSKYTAQNVAPEYVTADVGKGTLVVSVSGTGQVEGSNQVDVKPQVSGKVIRVNVEAGQEVAANAVIVQLDAGDAQKTVRDAQTNLYSAELALQKLKQPADKLSMLQAENTLSSAQDSLEKLKLSQASDYQTAKDTKQKSLDNITKGYEDVFNGISSAFLDLPTIMIGLDGTLHDDTIAEADKTISSGSSNANSLLVTSNYNNDRNKLQILIDTAESDYSAARATYATTLVNYKSASRFSDQSIIDSLLTNTIETAKRISEATKSESTLLDEWTDMRAARLAKDSPDAEVVVNAYRTDLTSYNGKLNTHLSTLLSISQTLRDNKDAVVKADSDLYQMDKNNPLDLTAAEQTVKEKQASLEKLKVGADPLDIKTQELTLLQRRNTLTDAQQKLSDYAIRAPLAGIIAQLNTKLGDNASSGTAVATMVTKQQIATITLNEVDVAKIKVGLKTTMTFDAVEGLEISGHVIEIDTLGTVAQGVVSYNVKIGFDIQDDRIKSGMSVSATIITNVKQDVLMVPNSAVKSQGAQGQYVEVLENGQPSQRSIQTGLVNDSSTEIVSGVNEGDKVITQTITSTTSTQPSSGGSIFGGVGGGGAVRALR